MLQVLSRVSVLFLAGFVLFYGYVMCFPTQWGQWQQAQALRSLGAERFDFPGIAGSLRGWKLDQCTPEYLGRSRFGCRCVALIGDWWETSLDWKSFFANRPEWFNKPVRFFALDFPSSIETQESYADQFYEALRPQCREWTVVGHGAGAGIAAWMGLKYSEEMNRLIWISPLIADSSRAQAPPQIAQRDWVERVIEKNKESELLSKLGTLRVPVIILEGEKASAQGGVAEGKKLKSFLRTAHLQSAKNCGFHPHQECPPRVYQALNKAILYGSF